jgi:AcrR family transcriptional regulator
MGSPEAAPPRKRSKAGRPPRINRQMIAEAAHERGLDGLTLRDVADHLGVSIAALYHHVSSKDDLMRLAAEYSAARVPLPVDCGQHWAVWLYEWAEYNRSAFLAQPGLLAQYLDGAIPVDVFAGRVDGALGALVRQGFTIVAANDAYELVTSCSLGTVVSAIREHGLAGEGRTTVDALRDVVAGAPAGALPYVRLLLDPASPGRAPFPERIATVLCGIAVRRGEDPAVIDGLVASAAASPAAATPAS